MRLIFLLAKSGTAQFWTHRELQRQRTAPDPDYRWQDALTGMEYSEEPEAYTEDMISCPECGGEGSLTKQVGQVSMFDGIPEMVRECGKCKGEGEVKRWKRVNLWQSHDYFYDAEAVRTASIPIQRTIIARDSTGQHRRQPKTDPNSHE